MTTKELQEKLEKENKSDKVWNYFMCVFVIIGGPYFLIKLITLDNWEQSPLEVKIFFFMLVAFFVGLGVFGFWRIPLAYKLTEIKTELNQKQNSEIITKLPNTLRMNLIESENNYSKYSFQDRFWDKKTVHLLAENDKILINVQTRDYGGDGGFLDFGRAKRGVRIISNEIKKASSQHWL